MKWNLREFQSSPNQAEWEMPPWGHPISQGIMPLLIGIEGKLIPIGTIFVFGRIQFMLSASHNVMHLLNYDNRFKARYSNIEGNANHDISDHLSLYVLHQKKVEETRIRFNLIPLRKIKVATPTDLMSATANFVEGLQTPAFPISFRLPSIGESIFSLGYSDFEYPSDGIDLDLVKNDRFDWQSEYGHKLFVREGRIRRLFTQRFSKGFLEGPCFSFGGEIRHGMSGGPIFNSAGYICGLNSAGATNFFGEPTSLGSLLYPLLGQKISFGANLGPLQLNATHRVLDLVEHGTITTDGSECEVALTQSSESGDLIVHPRSTPVDTEYIHDDFSSFQEGRKASKLTGEFHVIKKRETP